MTTPSMDSDYVDPASEDWQNMDDAALWHAAQAAVPQAVAELLRREHDHTPPIATTDPPDWMTSIQSTVKLGYSYPIN